MKNGRRAEDRVREIAKWLANDRPDYIHVNCVNCIELTVTMIEGPMQHFKNNFRTIEKKTMLNGHGKHIYLWASAKFTHIPYQTHTDAHNRWWNIKINDWKRQWRQRSTIVSRKKERTEKSIQQPAHVCLYLLPISAVWFLVSFSLSFAFVLLSTTKTIIAQSVVYLTIRHFKPHIA